MPAIAAAYVAGMGQWRHVRGHRYIYLRVRGAGRVSLPLGTGAEPDAWADARAAVVVRAVEQLVAAGAGACAKALCVRVARAASAAELEEARAAVARALEEAHGARPAAVTVRQFAERWLSGELSRLYPRRVKAIDQGDNRSRFDRHILPVIGDRPIAELSLDDGELVLGRLPATLSAAMARHVAQCLYRLARLAVFPGRVLARSPFPVGWLPSIGDPKAAPFLYPDEDEALLACTAIPLVRRVAYGLLAREGMRPGELVGRPAKKDSKARPPMELHEVDLVHGAIRLDRNKTRRPRNWALDPGTARALRAWKERSECPRPFLVGPIAKLAEQLREDLAVAGVTRAELWERTDERARMKGHHLRATFVTLSLANGKTESWVQDRTGHTSTLMIQRYRRSARTAAELGLGALAPLDEAIPELRP